MRTRIFALVVIGALWLVCSVWTSIAIGDPSDGRSIVGGRPVARGEWPDAVAVLGATGRCSGTLIAPDVVLTAGHCIGIAPLVAVIDAIDVDDPDAERIPVAVARAYPEWERSFDVGVVMLARGAAARPRAVARTCTMRERLRRGAAVTIVGFGKTTPDGSDDNTQKREAVAEVIDARCTIDDACQGSIDPGGEFIAGGAGHDACFGDSGGPAYLDTGHGPVLAGVVSRGLAGDWQCGGGGVFVRTDRIATWIEEVTGRRLARAVCDGSGDDPGEGEEDGDGDDGNIGCSAGAPGFGLVLLVPWVFRRRRRP